MNKTSVQKLKALPSKPYPDFPLFPSPNGQWRKDVWNSALKKSEPYYFGSWETDPKGEAALKEWLDRKDAIKAGLDKIRTGTAKKGDIVLGDLIKMYLDATRLQMVAGDLSRTHYGNILTEAQWLTSRMGEGAVVNAILPSDFSILAKLLITGDDKREAQGRHSRKRIIAQVKRIFNWGAKNGHHRPVNFGTDFAGPDTSKAAISKEKVKAGEKDFTKRIVTGEEIDELHERAQAQFKAIILLSVNCGLGPADLGRLRWYMLDLDARRLVMPRGKTGEPRHGFLWKRTVEALRRVQTLKHNAKAIAKDGDTALVFLSRKGLAMYREEVVPAEDGRDKVKTANAISGTFGKMARELGLEGVTQYRLRHTFKTLGKKARDPDALNFMMGHAERTTGKGYDHEDISWKRVRRVARVIYRRLWAKGRKQEGKTGQTTMRLVGDGDAQGEAA